MTASKQNFVNPDAISSTGTCLLSQWGLILVEGPDSATFLQSQLSNSVLGLSRTFSPSIAQIPSSARLIGYCSPKGRLLATAWLALLPSNESSDDRFALFISKDIAAATAKRLSMFVLRSKVKVIDASSEWTVSGLYSSVQTVPLVANASQIGLQLPNVLCEGKTYLRALLAEPISPEVSKTSNIALDVWNDLEVLSAIPRIVLATQEQFVPQMINFESVDGVDFKKGCYPGQEIVARSQYRGVIKRRLFLAHVLNDEISASLSKPGSELFHSEDASQPAGMVVLSAHNPWQPNRIDLQIECKLEALQSGQIHLGRIDGPVLKIDQLPYPLIEI